MSATSVALSGRTSFASAASFNVLNELVVKLDAQVEFKQDGKVFQCRVWIPAHGDNPSMSFYAKGADVASALEDALLRMNTFAQRMKS